MAQPELVEAYLAGFRDRIMAMRRPGQEIIDAPGVYGLLGLSAATLDGRVVVTNDRAREVLAAREPELLARVVYVFDDAEACRDLMSQTEGYRGTACTAMVCSDLESMPELRLSSGLECRPVGGEGPATVSLRAAAEAAIRSDPRAAPTDGLAGFLGYLRSIPNASYFAAVDSGGAVRATAATASWGPTAGVFFVNTDPDWRGRGVGTAMTAAALRDAAARGASRACLDSSDLGLSLYARLGFQAVGALTQFVRAA